MSEIAPTQPTAPRVPPTRTEYVRAEVASKNFGVVEKPLTAWEKLYNKGWLRKTFIILVIAIAWGRCGTGVQSLPQA